MRFSNLVLVASAASFLVRPSLAQVDAAAPGFALSPSARSVGMFDAYATLSDGERIVFDGQNVARVAEDGSSSVPLCSFPSYAFPSFVLIDPTETFAVVGESDFGLIHQVDLTLGGALFVADINYNYDALFASDHELLITAAPCLANCGSTLEHLDLSTGQVTTVATLPGPSGPIALAPNGDLYYGLQPISFPAPPGSWTIVYWRASQLASGNLLTLSDAFYFTGGLDGSSSMLFDPVYGHLLVAESPFSGTSHVVAFDRNGQRYSNVIEAPGFVSDLELYSVGGDGSFQAYQPPGMMLRYRSTDYVAFTSQALSVEPLRPVASLSGPGLTGPGPITFTVTGAEPNATFLLLIGPQAQYTPFEFVIDTGTYLFHSGLNVFRRTGVNPTTDAFGTGTHTFTNPGTLQGTKVLQAVIRNTSHVFVGTSTMALL